jgi:hypothetical protein
MVSVASQPAWTAMTLELKMLALSIVFGLVQIVLASHAASLQRSYVWTASSRDEAVPALAGVAGRLARALQNFVETFPLFARSGGVMITAKKESGASVVFSIPPKPKWEFPRLCRGGSKSLTYQEVHRRDSGS